MLFFRLVASCFRIDYQEVIVFDVIEVDVGYTLVGLFAVNDLLWSVFLGAGGACGCAHWLR